MCQTECVVLFGTASGQLTVYIYTLFFQGYSIDSFLKMNVEEPWNVNRIVTTITAKELCLPKDDIDHIEMIFKVCLVQY